MSAKEMFEKLGFTFQEECYEHPLKYRKKRKTYSVYEVDEDSFTFYNGRNKTIAIWKDGNCILLKYKELKAIEQQLKEIGWNK